MSARILILGAGDAGLKIAAGLAIKPGVRHIVLARRQVERLADPADQIASCGRAGITVSQVDGRDRSQLSDLLRRARPDLIVQCACLVSPWATVGRDQPAARIVMAAGVGLLLPSQLPILRNLMAVRAELGLRVPVANLSLPDLTHAVLASEGLAPLIGLGNVTIVQLRARARLRAKLDRNGGEDQPTPLIRVLGHHHHVYEAMGARPTGDPADAARIYVGEEAEARPDLGTGGRPVAAGRVYNVITAAAALETLAGLLPGASPIRISAPAPFGLLGGYPLAVAHGSVTLDLPAGLSRDEAEAFQRRMSAADGIDRIEADGTVHFTAHARQTVAALDPRLAEPLRLADLESRAEMLREAVGAA